MNTELIKLLHSHNTIENGISIPISVEEYVDKISKFATIVPYWSLGEVRGFIAYYNNDDERKLAFLTMILIDKAFQGRGIGKLLLDLSIRDLSKNGFKFYGLEVLKENLNAVKLYTEYGFKIKEERGELWYMEKNLI